MTITQDEVLPGGAREAFRTLRISQRRGYRMAAKGAFPFMVRVGATWIVPRRAFERYLAGEFRLNEKGAANGATH